MRTVYVFVTPVCAFLAVLGALCYFKISSCRGLQRQSEAIVTTISKAMSKTVSKKTDLELQEAATNADIDAMVNRMVIKVGCLMVTLIVLLMTVGPVYWRWVFILFGWSGVPAG